MMNIAVFGTGVVGQVIAERLTALGHSVTIGTRNVEQAMQKKATDGFGRPGFGDWKENHPAVKVADYAEAASVSELIINATNGAGTLAALEQAGKENLSGKILIDISNPLDFSKGMPPSLFVCNTDSLAEQIQRTYPELKVVKTLNTMNAYIMVQPSLLPGDHNVFVSGNDDDAKQMVRQVLGSIGWEERNIIDLGDITTARGTEQLLPVWIRLWGALQNPMFNFSIVTAEATKK
jgi:8-hydroxy-5-deazaflavin:NADPH oxidoreductase